MLPCIIHENQKGFMAGRYIGENTRMIYVILHVTKERNIPGLLLLIAFEKAFDSISWLHASSSRIFPIRTRIYEMG